MSGQGVCCGFLLGAVVALATCGQSADTITSQPVAHANDNAPRRSVAASQPAPSPAPRYGTVQRGEATFYPATGSGNCSFEVSDDVMVAALNSRDYATAALCGAYLEVTGPAGTVIVRVTDRCPGCKAGGLDLSRQAFARIATTQAGRVPVTWQIVAGPEAGPLTYRYMDGSTRYWTAIQVRNHRWPIAALAIKPGGASDWIAVERRAYNYFVYPKPIASGPLQLRVTALSGATMEDELPEPAGGVLVQGAAQFD